MASTLLTELETGLVKARLRSLSLVSHPGSPIDSPIPASPHFPATPVNTSATVSPAPATATASPSLLSPPANTPEDGLDSGLTTPSGNTAHLQLHPPDFLKTHHFYSPIIGPPVPPNSPENSRIAASMDASMDASVDAASSNALQTLLQQINGAKDVNGANSSTGPDTTKAPVAANDLYEIRSTPNKGYGCFATRKLTRGTRILADKPLLIVPVAQYYESDIKEPFSKLSQDEQALYFSLHSAHGQDPEIWPKHIHPDVETRERCRIEEQHKARVAKEPSLVSIFQTNCMGVDSGAGIFPNAARFNHSCNPNACFAWNPAIGKETIHAMRDIEKGEEITVAYCDIMEDKGNRRWELKHYGFVCDCAACTGDETDPDSFAAKSTANRHRLKEIVREEMTRFQKSDTALGRVDTMLEMINLLREEGDCSARLASIFVELTLVCEAHGETAHAKQTAEMALRTIIQAQGPDHPIVREYVALAQRVK